MTSDRYKYFRIEAAELFEQMSRGLLAVEQTEVTGQLVVNLMRYAHTLKGAARVVRLIEIADAAHAMEDELARCQAQGGKPNVQMLFELLDQCTRAVSQLTPVDGTVPVAAQAAPPRREPEVARVELRDVNSVAKGVAESLAEVAQLRASTVMLANCIELVELVERQVMVRRLPGVRQYEQLLRGTHATVSDVLQAMRTFERRFNGTLDAAERELRQAHESVTQLRLVSVATMFSSLERAVRDAATELGKNVRFEGHGAEVRLDAHMVDTVGRALVQLVRNAVAHGIEGPEQRTARGKPPYGLVRVEVERLGAEVCFRCQDDGQGIDVARLSRLAAGRLDAGDAPDADALMQLLLTAGVSTAAQVNTVAGRGVGMSIVREAIESVRGKARLENVPGSGLALELRMPATLTALTGLFVEAGGDVFVLPLAAVREAVRLNSELLVEGQNGEQHLRLGSELVPYAPLHALLGRPTPESALLGAVIVCAGNERLALGVDRLLGSKTKVVHPLPDEVGVADAVSGAVLDALGSPQLVLEVSHLIATRRQVGTPPQRVVVKRPILVVDDSLTTRMLQQSILESVGYAVELATSAEEALEKARSTTYGLFLVDVEMPGMDGFGFVERTRSDPRLLEIPSILVSSRSAASDLARGEAVGAKAYMVKDRFDQRELLRWIRDLLGY